MNFLHKINIANRVFKSLIFGQVPNYAIVYVDGRCNMHCDFCCHAAMDARNSGTVYPSTWRYIFKRAKNGIWKKKNIQDHEALNTNCTKKLNLVAE